MNRDLKDKSFFIPEKILSHLNETLKKMSHVNGEGMKRLRRLVSEKEMTYQQLKRLLYDFKNSEVDSDKYNLNGGKIMFNWVNDTLDRARKEVKDRKKSKQNASELTPGLGNAFRKGHEKNSDGITNADVSRLSEEINKTLKIMKRYL